MNVTNKKYELHDTLLADIQSDRAIFAHSFSQNDGSAVFKLISDASWYLDGRQEMIRLAQSFTSTITQIPEWWGFNYAELYFQSFLQEPELQKWF